MSTFPLESNVAVWPALATDIAPAVGTQVLACPPLLSTADLAVAALAVATTVPSGKMTRAPVASTAALHVAWDVIDGMALPPFAEVTPIKHNEAIPSAPLVASMSRRPRRIHRQVLNWRASRQRPCGTVAIE